MAQPSIAAYFNTRKRAAAEEISATRTKVMIIDRNESFINPKEVQASLGAEVTFTYQHEYIDLNFPKNNLKETNNKKCIKEDQLFGKRVTRSIKRIGAQDTESILNGKQKPLIPFIIKGNLSPKKKASPVKNVVEIHNVNKSQPEFTSKDNATNIEKGYKTPTKQIISNDKTSTINVGDIAANMSVKDIQKKLKKSSKLAELKTSINKVRNGLESLDRMQNIREMKKPPTATISSAPQPKNLKPFSVIEVDVPISPRKEFLTPTKVIQHITPTKPNELMSPRKTVTPRKLFSPTKTADETTTPDKDPAYLRYKNLVEAGKPTLQLPYKYRRIAELFKCMDTVCSMYFNRKEKITFKKLKPAIQRMLRKNVVESHLAQIQKLYPDAYTFTQEKTRNYGSVTKHDTYQLVITPNVKAYANSDQMTPQAMLDRNQKINNLLIDLVKDQHDLFLKSLTPPLNIQREKLTRWHPEFDLEKSLDLELGDLPQPPNVEVFSSAQSVLSTARNLFNCGTPMEKSLARFEENNKKVKEHQGDTIGPSLQTEKEKAIEDSTASLLKGVPKSLLEKIRAKQAAKALDAMTRRPSQDEESIKYGRLPELAKHVRNVFITEKKSVLPIQSVLVKLSNSYNANLTMHELEEHLKIISKEIPFWLAFHEVRKSIFLKLARDSDMNNVILKLKNIADSKA